jgi:hypothetical protein
MALSLLKMWNFSQISFALFIFFASANSYAAAWTQSDGTHFISIEEVKSQTSEQDTKYHKNYSNYNSIHKTLPKNYFNIYNEYGLPQKTSIGSEINMVIHQTLDNYLTKRFTKTSLTPLYRSPQIDVTKIHLFFKKNIYHQYSTSLTLKALIGLPEQKKYILQENPALDNIQTLPSQSPITYGSTISLGRGFQLFNSHNFVDLEFGYKKNYSTHPILEFSYGIQTPQKMLIFKFLHQKDTTYFREKLHQNGFYLSKIKLKHDQPSTITSIFLIKKTFYKSAPYQNQRSHSKEIGASVGIWINT